ncbi:hypothetical protein BDZ91DRAFT_760832 [Kalaharituber pfeilii]|nr:hypothetical protein BDZ91DRAFT_760832 [Kalaharituber pfeilii]
MGGGAEECGSVGVWECGSVGVGVGVWECGVGECWYWGAEAGWGMGRGLLDDIDRPRRRGAGGGALGTLEDAGVQGLARPARRSARGAEGGIYQPAGSAAQHDTAQDVGCSTALPLLLRAIDSTARRGDERRGSTRAPSRAVVVGGALRQAAARPPRLRLRNTSTHARYPAAPR